MRIQQDLPAIVDTVRRREQVRNETRLGKVRCLQGRD